MASFKLQWRSSTKKDLRKLPRQELPRIIAAAEGLATDPFPSGCEKLSGTEHTYRIRIGDYRLVYEVVSAEQVVEIQRVRHRKDVYRQ
ncbi:MAG: type II toxin-antitoxin system RelE/ParE family toxin [Bythopirellula sp.]|nr:type II toxin-antitoxin system RelE/ParE family toxin [Bythopirellula sp.]